MLALPKNAMECPTHAAIIPYMTASQIPRHALGSRLSPAPSLSRQPVLAKVEHVSVVHFHPFPGTFNSVLLHRVTPSSLFHATFVLGINYSLTDQLTIGKTVSTFPFLQSLLDLQQALPVPVRAVVLEYLSSSTWNFYRRKPSGKFSCQVPCNAMILGSTA